jgi:glycosyltransferase involved in cell wall biosynthesis
VGSRRLARLITVALMLGPIVAWPWRSASTRAAIAATLCRSGSARRSRRYAETAVRVLITPEWYPWPDRPYFGAFCREQARAVARNEDVAVLTWRFDSTLRVPFQLEATSEEGLRTFRLRFAGSRVPKAAFGFKLAGCVTALGRLLRRGWSPDVIHAHEYSTGPVALSLGLLARAPVVFSEHFSGFALGTLTERERRHAKWAFERASLVCPVSRDLAGHVQTVAPGASYEPVPNVVDTDVFVRGCASPPGTAPRLIAVGSLIEIKGHRHLILALARLRHGGRSLRLDLIGDGPLRPDLEALARDLGVDDLVRFHGAKRKDEVAAALRRADVFVLPSLWETLSCALLEALSTGLPVVATRVGGVPEVVGAAQGILVAPASSEALADGLRELVGTLPDYDRDRLRAKAVAEFGHVAIGRRWAAIYESVDRGSGPRRPARVSSTTGGSH